MSTVTAVVLCYKGLHDLDAVGVWVSPSTGKRRCKACKAEQERRWREANPEKAIARARAWRAANPEKVTAWDRDYRQRKADEIAARGRVYRKENTEGERARARAYRARKAGAESAPYTLALVIEQSASTCYLCGEGVDVSLSGLDAQGPTIDHVIPLAAGGADTLANVALAHRVCNLRKGPRPWGG